MATKTLTITEDAYKLLLNNKLKTESFSEEIRRIFSRRKTKRLSDFFDILTDKKGKCMLKDIKKIRATNVRLISKRIENEKN